MNARGRPGVLLALGVALVLRSPAARARPQVTSALGFGGGARWQGSAGDRAEGVFVMTLRADVLLGRSTPWSVGAGPWVSLRTDDTSDLWSAGGVSLLLPVSGAMPLVLSVGAAVDLTAPELRPAVVERLWWGSRHYNFHASYGLSAGFWVESRQVPGTGAVDLVGGAEVDLEVLGLGFLALYSWITH